MTQIPLSPGNHAFYGCADIEICSGRAYIFGACVSTGFSTRLFAPFYTLPIQFDCDSNVDLRVLPIPETDFGSWEKEFYCRAEPPEGFTQIVDNFYHSSIVRGPDWPSAALDFLDRQIQRKTKITFVAGGKGSGKSTLVKYFLNRIISVYGCVCLLNIDLGQPLVGLPGTVSLTILKDFLLAPEEHCTHMGDEIRFYGDITPQNANYFWQCVSDLVQHIPRERMMTVVNSFGWVDGFGMTLHRRLMSIIRPNTVISMYKASEEPPAIVPRFFRIETKPRPGLMTPVSRRTRELRIENFFGSVAVAQPIRVPFSQVRVAVLQGDIDPAEILMALSGSLVGLCVDERQMTPPSTPDKVRILREVPIMKCVGFGLIKAIDKENAVFHIVTEAEGYNTIVFGSVALPESFLCDTYNCDANYLGIGVVDAPGALPLKLIRVPNGHRD